ncbi:MAG: hypothetical protein R3E14_06840 [Erythrobacter sp.]
MTRLTSAAGKSLSIIPPDLFFPDTTPRSMSREVEIGPGLAGQLQVEIASVARPDNGLLQRIERRLVTRVGDDERLSREVWTLDKT